MTIEDLKDEIRREAQNMNNRLRRLEKLGLAAPIQGTLKQAQSMNSALVTKGSKPRFSMAVADRTENELKAQLKWIRAQKESTWTTTEAKRQTAEFSRKQGISISEAKEYLQFAKVFDRATAWKGGIFDSERVKEAIEGFTNAPDDMELINELYRRFGSEIQDEPGGRDALLEWMLTNDEIPDGVNADYVNGEIQYV